jgi:hypothetical protein
MYVVITQKRILRCRLLPQSLLNWFNVPRYVPSKRYRSALSTSTASERNTGPIRASAPISLRGRVSFMGLPPRKSLKLGIIKSSVVFSLVL